jgi:glycosyltransferase involved in cell wall biosynthesis
MKKNACKADLHVHSRYSQRPSSWILKKIGCAESYTDPMYLYHTLKSRGMDIVTITDHNTITGCLEIAHLEGTFISEEVTTYFPEDGCKLHVLAYNISEHQHHDISRLRRNVYELVDYLNAENIVHAIAHPLHSVNSLLRPHHFQKLLLLFKNFELNGAKDSLANAVIAQIVNTLSKDKIDELANLYDIGPYGDRPWKKILISGSDDHSSLYMGYSYTEIQNTNSCETFLNGISHRPVTTEFHDFRPETLAHMIYSIMYQFYDETFQIKGWIKDPTLAKFLNDILCPPIHTRDCSRKSAYSSTNRSSFEMDGSSVADQFMENAKKVIFSDSRFFTGVDNRHHPFADRDAIWLRFVNRVSEMILHESVDTILSNLTDADLFHLFGTIGSSASLYMMLSPYFISYSLFARDRAFSLECLKKYGGQTAALGVNTRHIAMFTDTFNEINGAASVIQSQVKAAQRMGKSLTLITCDPGKHPVPSVASFEPIGGFELPEYPELKIYYPPVLDILAHCWQEQYTHIHAETPGAMGLTALAVSNLLNLPFRGTYHTSLPQTVRALTNDPQIEELFWKYIVWFYGQMETIYVPSAVSAKELIAKGVAKEKLIIHPWGVNTTLFHPGKKNGFFSTNFEIKDSDIKLLYVGRVSYEKNLRVFEGMMREIKQARDDVHLIIVGEGPCLPELQAVLEGLPVTFTGYLRGESLSQAYASSDIFVFPSTIETMGNVVIEAQACGVPVIVTDKGGSRENMIDKKTGFIVCADQDLPHRFAEIVLHLCDNPHLMATMGENAHVYTQKRSFDNSFERFWNNYR